MNRIGVVGAGTWGMALTRMLANTGNDVIVWTKFTPNIDKYIAERRYAPLDNMEIPESVSFSEDMCEVVSGKDVVLMVVPSIFVRNTSREAAQYLDGNTVVVNAGKGIEAGTLMTLTEVISDELKKAGKNNPVVALSGPTHAEEVAKDIPSTIVSASSDKAAAEKVQDIFMNTCMRVYTNEDEKGIELCGALKNIIALASGISAGLGFGDNTKAALITRGLAEITRLGLLMGCKRETFAGLAGIGDLIVTATSMHSRNNRAGMLIGQGYTPEEAVKEVGMVVEGINALPAAMQLAEKYNIELPIIFAVNAVINEGADPRKTVMKLMSRDKKNELD